MSSFRPPNRDLPPEIWVQIASMLPHMEGEGPMFAWNNYRHVNKLFKRVIEDHYARIYCPWAQERNIDTREAEPRMVTRDAKLQSFHGQLFQEDVEPFKQKGKGRAKEYYPTAAEMREARRRKKIPSTNRLIFGADDAGPERP